MLPSGLLVQLPSLGVAGLLFVMWWLERQERVRGTAEQQETQQYANQVADANRNMLDVVRANTEVVTALREELRAHRAAESQWLARLAEQLEDLNDASQ